MELNIQKLLDLYFDGKTTTHQDQQLRTYFLGNTIKEEWLPYKSLFVGFQSSINEKYIQPIDLPKKRGYSFWWASAAIIAFLIIGGNLYKPTHSYTEQEAHESYAEFKENVLLVSSHLNLGADRVAHLETFNKTTTKYLKKE
jgi:hypothetical protein